MPDLNPPPSVYFNHLYVVLDDKTYRAIQASDFLRSAFPGMERRGTRTAAGETWYGTYYYCIDNYLEFFGASTGRHWQPGAQEGWAGVAFSTDQPGGVASVREKLKKTYRYEPFSELRQLRAPDRTINWFYHVNLAERLSLGSFDSWVMEYHPEIFEHKGIALPEDGQLSRKAYLSPWNQNRWGETLDPQAAPKPELDQGKGKSDSSKANLPETAAADVTPLSKALPRQASRKQKSSNSQPAAAEPGDIEFPRTPVFSRLIGATVHMDAKRAKRFADILSLFGYAQSGSGDQIDVSAHGFTLHIRPKQSAPPEFRLSSLRLQMARPSVAPMTFVFAPGSRLVLNTDLTADWFFGV